jgi:hypothetical protein
MHFDFRIGPIANIDAAKVHAQKFKDDDRLQELEVTDRFILCSCTDDTMNELVDELLRDRKVGLGSVTVQDA